MKQFVRGAGVHISVTFLDITGAIVTPTGANVTLSYVPKSTVNFDNQRTFLTFPLVAPTAPATDWTFDWDSSVSEPGVVSCHAVTTTFNTPVSSVDFSFRLIANRANKELAGDDCGGY